MKQLPSVKNLVKESWDLFKKSITVFLVFQLLFPVLALIAVGVPAGILGFLTYKTPAVLVIIILLAVIALIVLFTASTNALIIALGSEKKEKFGDYFRKGWPLVLPVIGVGFLVGLLTIGSFFLFVIPAIIVGFYLMFWSYEVILHHERVGNALRNSATIFSQHAWEIVGRILLAIGATYGIVLLITAFGQDNGATAVLVQIVNTIMGWYMLAYSMVLYKQVRSATNFEKQSKIGWIYGVSIAGWILLFIGLGAVAQFAGTMEKSIPKKLEAPAATLRN